MDMSAVQTEIGGISHLIDWLMSGGTGFCSQQWKDFFVTIF
jgi:hypothetical protein